MYFTGFYRGGFSVVLIFVIVVLSVLTSYIQADALAPAVVLVPAAVVLGLLVAYGVTASDGTYDSLGAMAQGVYNGMKGAVKDMIDEKTDGTVYSQLSGMGKILFSAVELGLFTDWLQDNYSEDSGSITLEGWTLPAPQLSALIYNGSLPIPASVVAQYNASEFEGKSIIYDGNEFLFRGYDLLPIDATRFSGDSNSYLRVGLGTYYIGYAHNGNYRLSSGTGTYDLIYQVVMAASAFKWGFTYQAYLDLKSPIYWNFPMSGSSAEDAWIMPNTNVYDYNRDLEYDPDAYPIPTDDITGDTAINVPVGNILDNDVVPVPAAPVTLNDVISNYGSLDAFFDAGGVITLGDGTTVSTPTDWTRADSPAVGVTDVETGYSDITGIKSIVRGIAASITGILTLVRDWTRTSDFQLDFEPLQVDFTDRFPFCIPFDFLHVVEVFSAEPDNFQFRIQVNTSFWEIDHTVDLSPFMMPILFFRYAALAWFIYILISKTRSMIKW